MKRIFFAGNLFGSGGPSEVNKTYVRHLHGRVMHLTISNPLFQFIEIILKLFVARVVIFSGIRRIDHLLISLCRLTQKHMIYMMHGCLAYEDKANQISNSRGEHNESIMLRDAQMILCVSESYRQWVLERYPQYSSKLFTLTNGIEWDLLSSSHHRSIQRDTRRIILIGGGLMMKHNIEVCRAVGIINDKYEEKLHIDIYGRFSESDDSKAIIQMPYITWCGIVSHETLLQAMRGVALLVQNSELESFGLGVVEALVSGCNILVSNNVGAIDIIPGLTKDDIIRNPLDIQEIADKIQEVLRVGNNERLLSSIDREATSSQTAAEQLYQKALLLLK